MPRTAQDMVERALVDLGVRYTGEAFEQQELDSGLAYLREMLDEWAIEGRMVPTLTSIRHVVARADTTYSLGSSGTTPDIEIELVELDLVEYKTPFYTESIPLIKVNDLALSRYKRTRDDQDRPSFYYFEPSYPKTTLRFNATTVVGDSFTLTGQGYLVPDDIALDDVLELPRGYFSAVRKCLTYEIAMSKGQTVTNHMASEAMKSKRRIKVRNMQSVSQVLPRDLPGLRGSNMLYHPSQRF